MRLCLVIGIIALMGQSNCFIYPTYQSGTGVGIFSNSKHVFLTENKFGRMIDIEVKFSKEFESMPRIAVANSLIEMEQGAMGYSTDVIKVSPQGIYTVIKILKTRFSLGFTIRATAYTEKQINEIVYNWFATNDPRVHVQYIQTSDLGKLGLKSEGQIQRDHTLSIPIINWEHKEEPLVQVFLIGASFKSGNTIGVRQQVAEIKENDIDLTFSMDQSSDAIIDFVKLCLIMTDNDVAYQTQELGVRVQDDHAWLQRKDGEATELGTDIEIPSQIEESKRTYLAGITGYEVPMEKAGIRVEMTSSIQQDHASFTFGTWDSSQLRELGVQALFFGSDAVKIFDDHCAELFSECNYEGESFKICGTENELQGFSGAVKSIHLPRDGYISLYNQQGLQGERMTIQESKQCLETIIKI